MTSRSQDGQILQIREIRSIGTCGLTGALRRVPFREQKPHVGMWARP